VKNGRPTYEQAGMKVVLGYLRQHCGRTMEVGEFTVLSLKAIRQKMIEAGNARSYINQIRDLLDELRKRTGISLPETDLAKLHKLPGLQSLILPGSFSDVALRKISGLSGLRGLRLMNAGLTDDAFALLKPLSRLQDLAIFDSQITDEGLSHVTAFLLLRALYLSHSEVTGSQLERLQSLLELESLSLTHSPLTDAGAARIAGLPKLTSLRLTMCRDVGDEAMKTVRKLTKLRTLNLDGTKVGDDGLPQPQDLKQLDRSTLPALTARLTARGTFAEAERSNAIH
jgi:Leucine-rich repeat (LRR) protein